MTRNLEHGCGDFSVDGFFEGTPTRLRELYASWVSLVGEFGPFEQVPTKSRIAFMVRVRFAGVVRLRKDELDDEVRDRIREAYDVGCQTHVAR